MGDRLTPTLILQLDARITYKFILGRSYYRAGGSVPPFQVFTISNGMPRIGCSKFLRPCKSPPPSFEKPLKNLKASFSHAFIPVGCMTELDDFRDVHSIQFCSHLRVYGNNHKVVVRLPCMILEPHKCNNSNLQAS